MSRKWINGVCRVGPIEAEVNQERTVLGYQWSVCYMGTSEDWSEIATGHADSEPAAREACEPWLPPEMPVVEWKSVAMSDRGTLHPEQARVGKYYVRVYGFARYADDPDATVGGFDPGTGSFGFTIDGPSRSIRDHGFGHIDTAKKFAIAELYRQLRADHHERIFGEVQG